jgi:hypothetical protein
MSPATVLRIAAMFACYTAGLASGIWLFRWGGRRLSDGSEGSPREVAGWAAHLLGGAIAILVAMGLVGAVLAVFFGVKAEG